MSVILPSRNSNRNNNKGRINKSSNINKYSFVYHFLPHPEHRVRAKLLSHSALFVYSCLLLLTISVFKFVPKVAPGVLGYSSNINIRDLFNNTNNERTKNGLSTLRLNSGLTAAAEKKAHDMFKNNYWAHVSPSGLEPWSFILAEKYDYSYAGENLAKNFNTSKEVVQAWISSSSHRENMLNNNYDEIGFAVVNGVLEGYETTLVVEFFGKPRDSSLIASAFDEQKLLDKLSPSTAAPSPVQAFKVPSIVVNVTSGEVLPVFDVASVSKYISLIFGGFVVLLLALDIWYSKRKSIFKFTGHTFAHLTFLILALLGVWFVLVPGKIL